MLDAARAKARRGELRISVPIGYVWHSRDRSRFRPRCADPGSGPADLCPVSRTRQCTPSVFVNVGPARPLPAAVRWQEARCFRVDADPLPQCDLSAQKPAIMPLTEQVGQCYKPSPERARGSVGSGVALLEAKERPKMAANDAIVLQSNFAQWQTERAGGLTGVDLWLYYAVSQFLKAHELNDEEIQYGLTEDGNDGGADGLYFLINHRILVRDDATIDTKSVTYVLLLFK